MSKVNIVTIGWWNGQSNLLDALYKYGDSKMNISSIVSMSDDGRTTWELMTKFSDELGLHLPPPWDLRRCLFMMSGSDQRDEFKQYLETVIERDFLIKDISIRDYFEIVWAGKKFLKSIERYKLDYKLPLSSSVKWHKVWNLLMANLYYNLDQDYHKMLDVMHEMLEVKAKIITVTTSRAFIRAVPILPSGWVF